MALPSRKALFILVLVLGALLAGSGLFSSDTSVKPAAQRGVLDLTQWNPEAAPPVPLDGEWSFYWGQLLGPDAFASQEPEPTGYLSLPGTWRRFRQGDGGLPADGYATLHLRVQMPETARLMAVRIPTVFSAFRLWANGELIARAGTVGTTAATSRPQYLVQIAVFEPGSPTLDLVLQISNFHQNWSGLVRSIEIGTFEQVVAAKGSALRLWASALGALTLLGVQNLFLFFRRRCQEFYLVVGSFIVAGALTAANDNELIFTRMGSGFGWELHWKIEYAAGFLLIILATRLVQVLFPQEARAGVFRVALVTAGAGILLVLLTPARIYTPIQPIFHFMSVLVMIYCLDIGIKAVDRKRPHAWLIVTSGVAITVWLEQEWPRYYGVLSHDVAIGVAASLVAAFGLALIHLFDHGRLAETAEVLTSANSSLNDRLRKHLAELQAARELLWSQEEEMHRKTAEFLQSRVQSKLLVVGHHLDEAEKWLKTDPERGRRELEIAQSQIEEVREKDVRLVSHLLHPTAISFGLGPAVQSLAPEYAHHFRVVIDMKPEVAALDDVIANSIPEGVRLAAYRVLAEALGNVRVHAQATEVRIELSQTPTGDLAMAIADNGRGFDPGAMTPGLGLRTMAARLAECGGSLAWESQPGAGTRLRVQIPLSQPSPAADN